MTPDRQLLAYAAGDGSIRFTWTRQILRDGRSDTEALADPVSLEEANSRCPLGWRLRLEGDQPVAWNPVERTGPAQLRMTLTGCDYRYDCLPGRRTFYGVCEAAEYQVVNLNVVAALTYFLAHEEAITALEVDYSI